MKRIYIAGKVTGENELKCKQKFFIAEIGLIDRDVFVVNPTKIIKAETDWVASMKICISLLLTCDTLYCLPDWKESRGATLEHQIAQSLGMHIIYQKEPII